MQVIGVVLPVVQLKCNLVPSKEGEVLHLNGRIGPSVSSYEPTVFHGLEFMEDSSWHRLLHVLLHLVW